MELKGTKCEMDTKDIQDMVDTGDMGGKEDTSIE